MAGKNSKKPLSKWELVQQETGSAFDDMFELMTNEAKKQYPGAVYTGDEAAQRVLCLQVPALSVRFLLQQEGWPLERFTQIVGPRASGKSSLAYDIIYWHRMATGSGVIVQVEPKPSPELMLSFFRWDKKTAMMHDCNESIEQWFGALRYWVKACQQAMDGTKEKEGRGRTFPVCFMVDSLTAVLDQALHDKFEAGADPSKHFATQASHLTDIMKYMPGKLTGYPFSWLGINHVKEGTDRMGNPTRTVPGGKAPQYHETLEIEVTRKGKVKRADESGYEVKLELIKNSLAPEQHIVVEKVTWIDLDDKDPETGHYRTKTMFDWHRASIDVIDQVQKGSGQRIKKKLDELLGLRVGQDGRCACDALGITDKKRMDTRTAGEMLEARLQSDAKFADELYPLLGIRRRFIFKPGVDYQLQTELAVKEGKAADIDKPEEVQELEDAK